MKVDFTKKELKNKIITYECTDIIKDKFGCAGNGYLLIDKKKGTKIFLQANEYRFIGARTEEEEQ